MKLKGTAIKNQENILNFGRIDFDEEHFKLYYSLSGLEFNFSGKLILKVNSMKNEKIPYLTIVLNEEEIVYEVKSELVIVLERIEVTNCKILKRTGINAGVYIDILELEIEKLYKIEDKEFFEIIGDSFTCGYGNLGVSSEKYSTLTEDGLQAYSYLLTKHYNMLPTFMCRSGYPLFKSPYAKTNLIDFYNVICEENSKIYSPRKLSKIILLNLGTNDNAYLRNFQTYEEHELFCDRYISFLKFLRNKNPLAPIVCVTNDIQFSVKDYIKRAFDNFDDNNKYFIELKIDKTKKFGNDGHLGIEQHKDWFISIKELIDNERLL